MWLYQEAILHIIVKAAELVNKKLGSVNVCGLLKGSLGVMYSALQYLDFGEFEGGGRSYSKSESSYLKQIKTLTEAAPPPKKKMKI